MFAPHTSSAATEQTTSAGASATEPNRWTRSPSSSGNTAAPAIAPAITYANAEPFAYGVRASQFSPLGKIGPMNSPASR